MTDKPIANPEPLALQWRGKCRKFRLFKRNGGVTSVYRSGALHIIQWHQYTMPPFEARLYMAEQSDVPGAAYAGSGYFDSPQEALQNLQDAIDGFHCVDISDAAQLDRLGLEVKTLTYDRFQARLHRQSRENRSFAGSSKHDSEQEALATLQRGLALFKAAAEVIQ